MIKTKVRPIAVLLESGHPKKKVRNADNQIASPIQMTEILSSWQWNGPIEIEMVAIVTFQCLQTKSPIKRCAISIARSNVAFHSNGMQEKEEKANLISISIRICVWKTQKILRPAISMAAHRQTDTHTFSHFIQRISKFSLSLSFRFCLVYCTQMNPAESTGIQWSLVRFLICIETRIKS